MNSWDRGRPRPHRFQSGRGRPRSHRALGSNAHGFLEVVPDLVRRCATLSLAALSAAVAWSSELVAPWSFEGATARRVKGAGAIQRDCRGRRGSLLMNTSSLSLRRSLSDCGNPRVPMACHARPASLAMTIGGVHWRFHPTPGWSCSRNDSLKITADGCYSTHLNLSHPCYECSSVVTSSAEFRLTPALPLTSRPASLAL